jgi:hypothetical protein
MASSKKKIKLIEMLENKEYNDLIHLCLDQNKELVHLKHSNNNLIEMMKSINPEYIDIMQPNIKIDEKIIGHKAVQTDVCPQCNQCGDSQTKYKEFIFDLYNERECTDMTYTPMVIVASELLQLQNEHRISTICPSSWLVAFIKMMLNFTEEQRRHIEYVFFDFPPKKTSNTDYTLWGKQKQETYACNSTINYKPNCGLFINNILHDVFTVDFPMSMMGGIPDLELLIHYTILSLSVSEGSRNSYEKFCENESAVTKNILARHMVTIVENLTHSNKTNVWDSLILKSVNGYSVVSSPNDIVSDEYTILIENLKKMARVNSFVYERSPLMVSFRNNNFRNSDEVKVEETKREFPLYYSLVRTALLLSAIKILSTGSFSRDYQFYEMVLTNGTNLFADNHIYLSKEVGVTFFHSLGSLFPGFFMLVNLLPKNTDLDSMSVFETSEDPLYTFYNKSDRRIALESNHSNYITDLEHRSSFSKFLVHYCKLFHKFNGKIPSAQPPKELSNLKEVYSLNLFKYIYKNINMNWFCTNTMSKIILYMKDFFTRKTNYCKLSKSTKLLYGLPHNEKSLSCDNFAFFNNPVLFTITDKQL